MRNLFIPGSISGGTLFRQMMIWKFLRCVDCNCELVITETNEYKELKICPKCGKKHLLIKKIRKEE